MTLTLDELAAQIREVLARENTPSSRDRVAHILAAALADRDFVAARFSTQVGDRKVVYEDPGLGFCIVVHDFLSAKVSGPHDHGPSWAIYGQAAGETLMRDFERLPAEPGRPARVRQTRSYLMSPGDVHVYNEGDVHAPSRTGPTRLIRIEGMNLTGIARPPFEVAEGPIA